MSTGIAPSELLKLTYPQLNAILKSISDNKDGNTSSSNATYDNPSRKKLAKLIEIEKKKQENGSR